MPGCGTCRYSMPYGKDLECRRHPPVPVMLPGEKEPTSYWPFVSIEFWCGEHKPDKGSEKP